MPAKSKAQKKFFGLLYAYKKGKVKSLPKRLKKIADSMTLKDLKDFTKTKEKDLPNKIEESLLTKRIFLFDEYFKE